MAVTCERLEHAGFIAHFHIDDVDEGDLAILATCVMTALVDGEAEQFGFADTQPLEDGAPQGGLGLRVRWVAPGERELGDADHGPVLVGVPDKGVESR